MRYRIDATLTAAHLLSQIPGLRPRVEEVLIGILETADEIRRLHGVDFGPSAKDPMRVHIGNHVIAYLLDLDRRTAKVVFVEAGSLENAFAIPKAG